MGAGLLFHWRCVTTCGNSASLEFSGESQRPLNKVFALISRDSCFRGFQPLADELQLMPWPSYGSAQSAGRSLCWQFPRFYQVGARPPPSRTSHGLLFGAMLLMVGLPFPAIPLTPSFPNTPGPVFL